MAVAVFLFHYLRSLHGSARMVEILSLNLLFLDCLRFEFLVKQLLNKVRYRLIRLLLPT